MSKLAKALSGSAGNAAGGPPYVEDVFSTYLFTGNGSDQSIDNGIDIAGKGGLVWTKSRSTASSNELFDTERGVNEVLYSDGTNDSDTLSNSLKAFNSNGFTMGNNLAANVSSRTGVSWSFRKAEKFFDIVTYTGDGTSSRTIAHSLGSVPAFMTVKSSSNSSGWRTYHASLGATKYVQLQSTAVAATYNIWDDTTPTDSVFSISTDINANGVTYVAYLFASDAGGFGDDEDENIISCGSYTGNGTTPPVINLGWEPQWILFKPTTYAEDWTILDVMRGWGAVGADDQVIHPNTSGTESPDNWMNVTSTGFQPEGSDGHSNQNGVTYIYIAIRRPMKIPEAGTEVFAPVLGVTAGTTITGFPVDYTIARNPSASQQNFAFTRMLGENYLATQSTAAESATGIGNQFDVQNGIKLSGWFGVNSTVISWNFKRAAGFMDVVAYTGNGTAGATQAHNLGVAPEFMIVKSRGSVRQWVTYDSTNGATGRMNLDDNGSWGAALQYWNNTAPTDSVFTLGTQYDVNQSSIAYIAYLFASVAGVSKVGSYTGTGADLNVDCGFTAGARFILIKRTDSTGDWYTYDSARGIVSGNDPYLLLNTTGAEVTNTDYIDPLASGFTVTSSAPAGLNANGGTYIFLAIA